jgi:hypothetical protein
MDPKILKAARAQIVNFLWPSGQSGEGVGGARVCALNYCTIAK